MADVPIFRKQPPPEPEPKPEPVPEPPRPRAIKHKACGGIAQKHCAHPGCTWRRCSCGLMARMRWDGNLATWRTQWRVMK